MLKIGLTGGIGSGKSTASKVFRTLGVPVYDSDSRARELMTGKHIRGRLTAIFGEEAYTGEYLNAPFIAGKVFTDKVLLDRLNGTVHPAVMEDFEKWAGVMDRCGYRYVVQENAILFDHGFDRYMDRTVTISAPAAERASRAAARDGHGMEDIIHRMENQLSDSQREARADHIVYNGEGDLLLPQIIKLHEHFSSR